MFKSAAGVKSAPFPLSYPMQNVLISDLNGASVLQESGPPAQKLTVTVRAQKTPECANNIVNLGSISVPEGAIGATKGMVKFTTTPDGKVQLTVAEIPAILPECMINSSNTQVTNLYVGISHITDGPARTYVFKSAAGVKSAPFPLSYIMPNFLISDLNNASVLQESGPSAQKLTVTVRAQKTPECANSIVDLGSILVPDAVPAVIAATKGMVKFTTTPDGKVQFTVADIPN